MTTASSIIEAIKRQLRAQDITYQVLARRLKVSRHMLYRWYREYKEQPEQAFSGAGKRIVDANREGELERKIGQLTMENDFLKKVLQRLEEEQEAENGSGRYTRRSRKKTKG